MDLAEVILRFRSGIPRLSLGMAVFMPAHCAYADRCRNWRRSSISGGNGMPASGIVKPKRAKSRLKREARASCRSILLRADLLGTAGCQPVGLGSLPGPWWNTQDHFAQSLPAGCRQVQAGSLRSPEFPPVRPVLNLSQWKKSSLSGAAAPV